MNEATLSAHYAIVNPADPSPRPWARFHTRAEAEAYLRGCHRLPNGDFQHPAGFCYRVVKLEQGL